MAKRDTTQSGLRNSAIRLFGQYGYDSVSTRMLADDAQTNVASIKYHFGSKDELYVAVIDHIVAEMQPRLDIITQVAAQAKSVAGTDPARQAQVITELVGAVLTTLFTTPILQTALPFVLRELVMPGPHFDHLYQGLPQRLHETITDLVAWILDLDPLSETAKIRTHALVGQILIFHLGRSVLLHRLDSTDYNESHIKEIRKQVTTSVLASLGLPHAAL